MIINEKEDIWAEKYRPQRIQDMILPESFKSKLEQSVEALPNILLASKTPGTGKTSLVNAIIRQTGLEALFVNASLENGIDTLRGKIKSFASQCSLDGRIKIVVLDEADKFSPDAQGALRGFIEEYSRNCRFILTCNYIQNIIEPIQNRCEVYDFDSINKSQDIVKEMFNRLKFILDNENITYNPNDIVSIIRTFNPSLRQMIIFMQKSIQNKQLVINESELLKSDGFNYILDIIKQKDFNKLTAECYSITSPDSFYSWIFKNINIIQTTKKPQVILTIAKYQDMSSRARDKNLNLCACLVELASLL